MDGSVVRGYVNCFSAAFPTDGYRDYQNPGYKKYGSACSLWNTVRPVKLRLLNPEFYGRIRRNENG
jgi:hypothetical protein